VPNGTETILSVIGGLPSGTPAAFEAAFGWGWLVELLEDYGFAPHLVHPLQCKAIASARLKNDKVDAAILAQLLRADLLPEAWIAPAKVRQLRALLRHRASLVRLGTQLRNRIHAVAADHGYDRSASYWTGPGRGWLAELDLPPSSREIVADCLAVIDGLEPLTYRIDGELHAHAIEETYYAGHTPFQSVAVLRTPVFGKMLVLDGDTQSSQADEKIYHETLVHPAMASTDDRSEVLILGGGEGATLREVLRDPSVRRCTMVDIDGEVVELSKKFLPEWSDGAFDDPRARVIIGDALKFIKEDRDRYGVVISDLTEPLPDSPSFPLFNGEVFRDIKARLVPGGVYVLQASTAGFHNMALHAKMARSLRAYFTHVRSFYTHVPAFDNDWAFIACSDDADVAQTEPARIDAYVDTLRGENFFYDSQTHRRLFSLPLYLRRELAKNGDVFA